MHMTDTCNFAPTRDDQSITTQDRAPMMKSHTFDALNQPHYQPLEPQGYGYPNQSARPLFHNQERHLMRPTSFQTTRAGYPPQVAYSPQRFPEYPQGTYRGRALPDPPLQEQRGQANPSTLPPPRNFTGNYPQATKPPHLPLSPTHRPHMPRDISATQEEASGAPVSKVQSPLNMATEATKVILLWSKEKPTLERELTYFDNSQDVVMLVWTDEQSLYQGNGTLAVGKHHGSLLFPSSGDMVQVHPFEVGRKPMGMFRVKLKLNEPQAQESSKAVNLDTGEAERNSNQIEKMRTEIQELITNNNNIKSEKEKCKYELAKLDEQIIGLMTELSSVRVYGREEEMKLNEEVEKLKSELHTLRATPRHNLQAAEVSNEVVQGLATIGELKLKIKELREENSEFDQETANLKSEKYLLEEQNEDLKESNLEYERQIGELIQQQQQQQPSVDADTDLTTQLETAKQLISESETEIKGLKDTNQQLELELKNNLFLLQHEEETAKTTTTELECMKTEKQQILEQSRSEIEQMKQTETNLQEQLTRAREELEELQRQSRDNERTDQDILALSTNNDQLIQQVASLQEDNAKLQEEFAQKPSKQELIAQLDDTQSKVTELLQKCNSLEKAKNEIEDTLGTELKESRDEVFLLKTETNRQTRTIDEQSKVIETYKQQQNEDVNKHSEAIDKQISHLKLINLELEASKKTRDTHIVELNDELQQCKSDYHDLDELRKQSETEISEKGSTFENDKIVLEVQVDVLSVQIGELSEEKERWQRRVAELDATLRDTQSQLQKSHDRFGSGTETIKKYEQQITELANQNTSLNNELISVKESASISKQLIGKLNHDIEVLETNNKHAMIEFETRQTQSDRYREDLERKLYEITREVADRDNKIQELSQHVATSQTKGQVVKSPSTPVMPANPKLTKDKEKGKGKEVKIKHSEGATPSATNMDLTPELIAQANKSGKSPSKIIFRSGCIHVVKLKAFPNTTECVSKQVLCSINKRYEVGILIIIVDLTTKVGFKNVVSKHAGIKLYNPVGSCDGVYKGERYFDCPPNCGIFVPLEDVYVPVP